LPGAQGLKGSEAIWRRRNDAADGPKALGRHLAAAGIEESEIKTMISGSGIEETAVQALLAASALGLQNGLTSSFRGMPVRTTHFTGTVTDLGLMLGRARREGIDKWKFAILTSTLLFFLTGAIGGLLIGAQIGGHALLVPTTICLVLAAVSVSRSRRRRNQRELAAAEASTWVHSVDSGRPPA
jgi:hypothetical protein